MRKMYFIFLTITVFFTACSSTNQVTIRTMEPAPVTLSKQIKRIGIIDRSTPMVHDENRDRIARIVSRENRWMAEKGVDAALSGLLQELQKDARFDTVQLLSHIPEQMKDFGSLSTGISWTTIASLCKKYDLDAIFSLASYETDTKVSVKKTKMEERGFLREKNTVSGHEITLETLIENGWRIYDPINQQIIDEFTLNDRLVSSAKGRSPLRALRSIGSRTDSIISKSKSNGSTYGLRLQPYKLDVNRDYFVRGTDNFVKADEKAKNGDWQAASVLWKLETTNERARIRSKACYNMAVYNEVTANLEVAIEWASKSLTEFKNKDAQQYLDALKYRATQKEALLAQQASR